jgi:hypothetical protein
MEFIAEKYYLILFRSLTGHTPQRFRLSKVLVVPYNKTVTGGEGGFGSGL